MAAVCDCPVIRLALLQLLFAVLVQGDGGRRSALSALGDIQGLVLVQLLQSWFLDVVDLESPAHFVPRERVHPATLMGVHFHWRLAGIEGVKGLARCDHTLFAMATIIHGSGADYFGDC